jgi:hypothetical protein
MAATCRAKTTSKPTSLPRAVRTATSAVSVSAGSGRPRVPAKKAPATAAASVLLPPLPKVSSRPPAANRSAIARAHASSRSPNCSATSLRTATISAAFSAVDRRTASSTTSIPCGSS